MPTTWCCAFWRTPSTQVPRIIGRINNPRNAWLFDQKFHVDVALNEATILAHLIEEEMSLGDMMTLLKLRRGQYSLVEVRDSGRGLKAVGVAIKDLALPDQCVIAAIIRQGKMVLPARGDNAASRRRGTGRDRPARGRSNSPLCSSHSWARSVSQPKETPTVYPPDGPRRAGPEPGDAALVGRGEGPPRCADGNHHTCYAQRPAAAKRRTNPCPQGTLMGKGCPARKRGQGVLPTPLKGCPGGQGAVPGQPPSSADPWESPGADLALRHAHCHNTLRSHGPPGRSGSGPTPKRESPLRSTWFAAVRFNYFVLLSPPDSCNTR